ncbi:MAG: hypothetical protein NT129_02925 [Candidatus Aenigmarchaeota archaeon]|nr:hypothetical protein [Candidatus Aenigmarchaeota archaeon]
MVRFGVYNMSYGSIGWLPIRERKKASGHYNFNTPDGAKNFLTDTGVCERSENGYNLLHTSVSFFSGLALGGIVFDSIMYSEEKSRGLFDNEFGIIIKRYGSPEYKAVNMEYKKCTDMECVRVTDESGWLMLDMAKDILKSWGFMVSQMNSLPQLNTPVFR